jgi:vitamin B12/bleomycin/antimicrobial peptide transport system ATP-binding/permease protein
MPVRPRFWRDTWSLIKPYWKSEEKLSAWLLLGSVIGLTLAMVYMNVLFNEWYNLFYNSLQEKNTEEFWKQILRFCVLAAIYIAMAVYAFYLNQMLQIRWRRWMTDNYLRTWLSDRTYYRMQLAGNNADNPDQRIAEDLKLFVDDTLGLSLGLLNAVVTLVSFVGILWTLSGPLALSLGGSDFVVPGYMVWAAVLYAIVGSWVTHKIGRPLIGLNFNQQRYEADFRFGLIRFRENSESVALYRGEEDELKAFGGRFASVVDNWWRIMKRQKILISFTVGYNQIANIFPFVVAAPRYFSGAIPLGGLMQISNAFGQVQGALSWFIGAYNTFEQVRRDAGTESGVAVTRDDGDSLVIDGMSLDLPGGEPLTAASSVSIAPGESLLIRGPSGSGKSTLFRAIAGIWPFGSGTIRQPRNFNVLFLPQRPYLPIGKLIDVVSFPHGEGAYAPEKVAAALTDCGLAHLAGRLKESRHWAQELSPGEQQRIAFARALLHQPSWLFLDEATSALDEAFEEKLYRLLRERLPGTAIISIGHRRALAEFHTRRLELRENGSGLRELVAA